VHQAAGNKGNKIGIEARNYRELKGEEKRWKGGKSDRIKKDPKNVARVSSEEARLSRANIPTRASADLKTQRSRKSISNKEKERRPVPPRAPWKKGKEVGRGARINGSQISGLAGISAAGSLKILPKK